MALSLSFADHDLDSHQVGRTGRGCAVRLVVPLLAVPSSSLLLLNAEPATRVMPRAGGSDVTRSPRPLRGHWSGRRGTGSSLGWCSDYIIQLHVAFAKSGQPHRGEGERQRSWVGSGAQHRPFAALRVTSRRGGRWWLGRRAGSFLRCHYYACGDALKAPWRLRRGRKERPPRIPRPTAARNRIYPFRASGFIMPAHGVTVAAVPACGRKGCRLHAYRG